MREVACFLSPSLYNTNYPSFVVGLRKNGIETECFDINAPGASYEEKVKHHNTQLAQQEGLFCQQIMVPSHDGDREGRFVSPNMILEDYNFLCIAFEDSRQGVRAARKVGMCVIGIGSNVIEQERLKSQGAHAVASSISELLVQYHIRNYYQVQYLPYIIFLQVFQKKFGYPVSLLDTLRGKFIKNGPSSDDLEEEEEDLVEGDVGQMDEGYHIELDPNAHRIIPRDVLGIEPGSLADVYINNVGWPADKVPTYHFHTRGLEMDIIRIFERYYSVPIGTLRGFVTTGGTEGNFTGLWWQRDYLRKKSHGERPILLSSTQTHYSVKKAAQQLDIDSLSVATVASGEISCVDLERTLDDLAMKYPNRPVLMVVNAGTTQTGAIDNLPKIRSLLVEKVPTHFSIHLDAALMGAVLPIVNPFGPDMDYFNDMEVKTVAISGHKFFWFRDYLRSIVDNSFFS